MAANVAISPGYLLVLVFDSGLPPMLLVQGGRLSASSLCVRSEGAHFPWRGAIVLCENFVRQRGHERAAVCLRCGALLRVRHQMRARVRARDVRFVAEGATS